MSKYSIILPVKNGGYYVKQCVDSILNQTYADFNLIILDNQSSDGTTQWLQSLTDSRIIVYPSSKSLSMEENWARIKQLPKNEFMTIIGHDDILHENYLQLMHQLVTDNPDASLYQTHFNFIDNKGDFIRKCQPMTEIQSADEFLLCHIKHTLDSMGTGYMFRSTDYEKLGGISPDYPNLIFADYQLWIQLTSISFKVTSSQIGFYYRIHESVSKTTKGDEYCIAFEKYVFFIYELMKCDPKIKKVITQFGDQLLYYYCESLSHRLLKTSINQRKLRVVDFIEKCKFYSSLLIPDQKFIPEKNFKIRAAKLIDNYSFLRVLFYNLRK